MYMYVEHMYMYMSCMYIVHLYVHCTCNTMYIYMYMYSNRQIHAHELNIPQNATGNITSLIQDHTVLQQSACTLFLYLTHLNPLFNHYIQECVHVHVLTLHYLITIYSHVYMYLPFIISSLHTCTGMCTCTHVHVLTCTCTLIITCTCTYFNHYIHVQA